MMQLQSKSLITFILSALAVTAAILALSSFSTSTVKAGRVRELLLRGGAAALISNDNEHESFLHHILRRLVNFDKEDYEYQLHLSLKDRIGFSSMISPSNDKYGTYNIIPNEEGAIVSRDLRADTDYTFTPCAEEFECDSIIKTYTRDELYEEVSSVLKQTINVPYCLTAVPAITEDMYGSCGVADDCVCLYCLGKCLFKVCDSQCYQYTGADNEIAAAIKHGVQVRKVCASCEEETNHPGFTNQDSNDLGYCDTDAYGYEAKSSGLVVLPTDDGGNILEGALPVSAWAHVTIAGTCDTPTGTQNGSLSIDAIMTLLMGSSGTVAIAPDTLGYSNTYNYQKGYLVKKQYQTSFIPLWVKTKRTIAEETGCISELGNGLTIAGYSEGGYGSFAIAEAAESAGIDVQTVLSGAGPYLLSSVLLTTGFVSMAEGSFPSNKRHYLIQFGQPYSSTFGGMENYGAGQDLLANSWFVGNTQYTKHDAINAVTNLGGSNRLNKMIPSPTSIDTLDVWNPSAIKVISDAVSEGSQRPCDDITGAAAAGVDKLCDALVANDLEDYIKSIGNRYEFELCFSYDDEIIHHANVIQGGNAFTKNAFEVSGNHDEAGSRCIQRVVNFFSSESFTSYVPERTGDYCGLKAASTFSEPSSSNEPTDTESSKATATTTTTEATTTISALTTSSAHLCADKPSGKIFKIDITPTSSSISLELFQLDNKKDKYKSFTTYPTDDDTSKALEIGTSYVKKLCIVPGSYKFVVKQSEGACYDGFFKGVNIFGQCGDGEYAFEF